jgi:hypothetical protein
LPDASQEHLVMIVSHGIIDGMSQVGRHLRVTWLVT